MRPTRFAAVIAVVNAVVLFFLVITIFGLASSSFPVQFTDINGNRFLGHGISDFTFNGILGLLLLVIILVFVELVLVARLWRRLREIQGLPPPRPLEKATGYVSQHTPRSARVGAFVVLATSLFAPPVIYGALAYAVVSNNSSSVSSVLSMAELGAFFFLFADAIWPAQPDVRFASFRLNRNRHKVWLGINMTFYYLVLFESIEILFTIIFASIAYFHQPASYGDPLQLAALLSFLYFFSLVVRNSICRLMGQGYGRFTPFPGKIAGTSIVGVAAMADVARSSFMRAELRGKNYLQSAVHILAETLSVRRVQLDGLDELDAALSFIGSFGTPVPYDRLTGIAAEFANLGLPLESVRNLSRLTSRIRGFLSVTQWPNEFRVIAAKRWSENATLAATVIGAVVTAIGITFEVLHISAPSTGIAISIGLLGDALAIVIIAAMVWLSYGPYSRLEEATVNLGDLRRL
ncbi:MAG: hypothetical protein JRN34_00690 [Nitrososphaerota archaeon]|nr:hypothetical protein [Nitrososphaerota archaeon]